MNSAFINSDNCGTVIAWCSVLTLAMGVGMTIYQVVQQKKQLDRINEAQEAMRQLPMPENNQAPVPTAA